MLRLLAASGKQENQKILACLGKDFFYVCLNLCNCALIAVINTAEVLIEVCDRCFHIGSQEDKSDTACDNTQCKPADKAQVENKQLPLCLLYTSRRV